MKTRRLKKVIDQMTKQEDFAWIFDIQKDFEDAEIYLVGGMVRDTLLKRESKDYDFVVRNVKATDLKNCLEKKGWVDIVGRNFGVLKFIPKGADLKEPIDIALPRTEFSTGARYTDFEVQSDPSIKMEDDLSRRDFTINAMALNVMTGELIDPYDGQKDLKNKVIKTVGKPADRFSEDYSRMLRAIRFAAQLDFEIEKNTWKQIQKLAPKILDEVEIDGEQTTIVPYETISQEFLKTINADPIKTLDLYDESGLLDILLPEVSAMKDVPQPEEFHAEGDVYVHTRLALEKIDPGEGVEFKLATLFHDVGKPPTITTPEKDGVDRIRFNEHPEVGQEITRKICKRLRLSKKMTDHVIWLVKNHMVFVSGKVEDMRAGTIKKYFIDDIKRGDDLLELYKIDMLSSENNLIKEHTDRYHEVKKYVLDMRDAFKKADIKTFRHVLSGEDVMNYFDIKPGPDIGKYLAQADEFIFNFVTKNKKEPGKEEVLGALKK